MKNHHSKINGDERILKIIFDNADEAASEEELFVAVKKNIILKEVTFIINTSALGKADDERLFLIRHDRLNGKEI